MNIERIKEKSMESGYYHIDRSNMVDILGTPLESGQNDAVFIDMLNPEQSENALTVSPSMTAYETNDQTDELIADLTCMALGPSYGLGRIRYIDMQQSIASRSAAARIERRIENLHKVKSSMLLHLVLVNAGINFDGYKNVERKIERASALTSSLSELPETTFRVGMIASPEFMRAVGLRKGAAEAIESPPEKSGVQPVAVPA